MPYLRTLGLENFRLFKDQIVFELAPITILTGKNNSGKSSLIKSLQLFQSSLSEIEGIDKLLFIKGRHNLGWFSKTVNENSQEKFIKFTFDFPVWGILERTMLELTYTADSKTGEDGYLTFAKIFIEGGEEIFRYETNGWKKGEEELRPLMFFNFPFLINYSLGRLKHCSLESEEMSISRKDFIYVGSPKSPEAMYTSVFSKFHYNVNLWPSQKWDSETEVIKNYYNLPFVEQEKITTKMDSLWNEGLSGFQNNLYEGGSFFINLDHAKNFIFNEIGVENNFVSINIFDENEKQNFVPNTLSKLGEIVFKNIFKNSIINGLKDFPKKLTRIEHLSSIRANTERLYSNHSDVFGFNELLREFSKLKLGEKSVMKKFIENSLKLFEIGEEIKVNRTQGVASEIFIKKNDKEYLLADMGFGYTQLIPIILKIALIVEHAGHFFPGAEDRPESIFLLEEPESNLHPSYQSKLAEMIVEAGEKFNIQFIIETHSEYFIRNLQYLSAIKKLKPQDTIIYYFHHPESDLFKKAPYRVIDILEDGRLSKEFGEGFFDEIPRLLAFLYNSNFN